MSNRVSEKIAKIRDQVAERVAKGLVTPEQVERNRVVLDLPFADHASFQTIKSAAFTEGKITYDESMTVYRLLGETADHFNAQPFEVKYVLNQLLGELVGMKIATKKKKVVKAAYPKK